MGNSNYLELPLEEMPPLPLPKEEKETKPDKKTYEVDYTVSTYEISI